MYGTECVSNYTHNYYQLFPVIHSNFDVWMSECLWVRFSGVYSEKWFFMLFIFWLMQITKYIVESIDNSLERVFSKA